MPAIMHEKTFKRTIQKGFNYLNNVDKDRELLKTKA